MSLALVMTLNDAAPVVAGGSGKAATASTGSGGFAAIVQRLGVAKGQLPAAPAEARPAAPEASITPTAIAAEVNALTADLVSPIAAQPSDAPAPALVDNPAAQPGLAAGAPAPMTVPPTPALPPSAALAVLEVVLPSTAGGTDSTPQASHKRAGGSERKETRPDADAGAPTPSPDVLALPAASPPAPISQAPLAAPPATGPMTAAIPATKAGAVSDDLPAPVSETAAMIPEESAEPEAAPAAPLPPAPPIASEPTAVATDLPEATSAPAAAPAAVPVAVPVAVPATAPASIPSAPSGPSAPSAAAPSAGPPIAQPAPVSLAAPIMAPTAVATGTVAAGKAVAHQPVGTGPGGSVAPPRATHATDPAGPAEAAGTSVAVATKAEAPVRVAMDAAPAASPAAQVASAVAAFSTTNADGSHSMTLQLEPAELGRVQISIDRNSDGTAAVRVAADRPETLALLQADQQQLQHSLDQAGVPSAGRSLVFHLADPVTATAPADLADAGQVGGAANSSAGGGGGQGAPGQHGGAAAAAVQTGAAQPGGEAAVGRFSVAGSAPASEGLGSSGLGAGGQDRGGQAGGQPGGQGGQAWSGQPTTFLAADAQDDGGAEPARMAAAGALLSAGIDIVA